VTATGETGRYRQRRRTRAAIVAAAADLLRAGRTPSVNDVAAAADVSRRTVYLYFPTIEQLLIDATLGMLSQAAVDEAIDAADTGDDATERVAAMIRALGSMSAKTLPLGRSLLRLTIAPVEFRIDQDTVAGLASLNEKPTPVETASPSWGKKRVLDAVAKPSEPYTSTVWDWAVPTLPARSIGEISNRYVPSGTTARDLFRPSQVSRDPVELVATLIRATTVFPLFRIAARMLPGSVEAAVNPTVSR